MNYERTQSGACLPPFPIHPDLADDLVAAHRAPGSDRDALVSHVLGTCAAYAYSDLATVATIMSRVGLENCACVRVAQTVDAMFIFSTAYLVQSRCGRVVILCYRGTEPTTLGNWLGDADVGSDSIPLRAGDETVDIGVHCGFHRNVRATQWSVLNELQSALEGRSLHDPETRLPNAMEALYVTGHSLGGAMAVLFALSLAGTPALAALAEKLRAVYTYGQPMAVVEPKSRVMDAVAAKLFRHVRPRDIVPSLPPLAWGQFSHIGNEYSFTDGEWMRSEKTVEQLASFREIPARCSHSSSTESDGRAHAIRWPSTARTTISRRCARADASRSLATKDDSSETNDVVRVATRPWSLDIPEKPNRTQNVER